MTRPSDGSGDERSRAPRPEGEKPVEEILRALRERAKELNCLYEVDEILNRNQQTTEEVFRALVAMLPVGWQYPEHCRARLVLEGKAYEPEHFQETSWLMKAPIAVGGETVGEVQIFYTKAMPTADEGPFLKEERRLLHAVAERIGLYLWQQRIRQAHQSWESAVRTMSTHGKKQWNIILDFLRETDPNLLMRITRKMINFLYSSGVAEAEKLLEGFLPGSREFRAEVPEDNRPLKKTETASLVNLAEETFVIAAKHLSEQEIVSRVRAWIKEQKSSFLLEAVVHLHAPLEDVANALERFKTSSISEAELPHTARTELKVSLIRRFLSDQIDYINIAKKYAELSDFHHLVKHVIGSPRSHGSLGGKSAGLFLACQIVNRSGEVNALVARCRIPRTWFIASDAMMEFLQHNSLDDLHGRKYMDVGQVRQDYPHVVQLCKSSQFPPEIVRALSVVLDEIESRPLIVRSSSLLEDRTGAAFSGKYKSLFLANQGSKKARLAALQDAIAEVYASIFNPDVIEYRAGRGLLDVHEEMAIMIQEVVGRRVGRYFLPAFSGVAFSQNEFRWSARIQREDGLVRLVPGLGTRAVDRLSDDFPILIAPGQPNLRVNVTPDEIVRYSPKRVDVLNLETNTFETILVKDLLREHGQDYPQIRRLVSIVDQDRIRKPGGLGPDFETDELVVTFDGLISDTPFTSEMRALLRLLEEKLGRPVDIEFASDGEIFYLLQCRPQSYADAASPSPIPRNLPAEKILFTANQYVSNGRVSNITHIVYVDPDGYYNLGDLEDLRDVGRAVGRLNKILPKRRFILMGPGRWGSRGDIKLGVSVTYSDINNTALLVEMARKKGNYVPDLSFGTHFFQDLVEEGIRYLPLYPDDEGIVFNELFLKRSHNLLKNLVPEFSSLQDIVRVIDIPAQTEGKVCHVLMNAELDEAVGILADPGELSERSTTPQHPAKLAAEDHWRWRARIAEQIASELEPERFGVKGVYLFGSVKNATAGPGSDIDLLVHFGGTERQKAELAAWLEGWSLSLADRNYLRTGYKCDGLLDVHYVTDEDIARRTSYAVKINAVTDAARPLPLKNAPS